MIAGLLQLEKPGMSAWVGRDCTQTLELLPLGGLHRTVRGTLLYTGGPTSLKYRSLCRGKGSTLPGINGLKRGDELTVRCLQRLWQEGQGSEIELIRPAVPETVLVVNEGGDSVDYVFESSSRLKITPPPLGCVSITYCPILTMRVVEMKIHTPGWGQLSEWALVLEEL